VPGVAGKYELDSLAAVMKLSYGYWNWTKDTSCFDDTWLTGAKVVLDTIARQQAGSEEVSAP
jgi:meiotically up-regulated gene 157 (Mug157) protein